MPPRKNTCSVCGPTEKSVCRFPQEKERREQWCSFSNISPDELLVSSRLCIEHFGETDVIISRSTNHLTLKFTAIPTVYTPNQLRRLKISSPSAYDRIKRQMNSEVQLKTSIVNQFKSIFSKNTCHQNAPDVENPLFVSNKVGLTDETISMDLEPCSSSQRSVNEMKVEETSWMDADTSSNSFEITPVDVCNNDAVKDVEVTCSEASNCTPEVQIQSHIPTTNVIADLPLSNTLQPLPQLVSPIIEKAVDNEAINELQVTPKMKIISNAPRSRKLRFIADITTPDLATPRRRTECLKVIRYENKQTKSKMRLLQQENQRLKTELKTLKGLLRELQTQNLL